MGRMTVLILTMKNDVVLKLLSSLYGTHHPNLKKKTCNFVKSIMGSSGYEKFLIMKGFE